MDKYIKAKTLTDELNRLYAKYVRPLNDHTLAILPMSLAVVDIYDQLSKLIDNKSVNGYPCCEAYCQFEENEVKDE